MTCTTRKRKADRRRNFRSFRRLFTLQRQQIIRAFALPPILIGPGLADNYANMTATEAVGRFGGFTADQVANQLRREFFDPTEYGG